MKKYTYFHICLLDILIPGTLLAMIAVTSMTSFLLVISIGIADFCHNSTQNFINLELLDISQYTMNYYLSGNDPEHAINISNNPYLLDAQKKMHNVQGEISSIDLNSLKGILDELVYNGTQIANSVATKSAFTELRRVLCDVSIEGLLIQAGIAGPCAGLFLTLMLLATCHVRIWQKALLCIFLTEGEKCFSKSYNCQHKPCKMLLHLRNITGKGSEVTISLSDVKYDKKEKTRVGIATTTPTATTPTAIATTTATVTTTSEEDSASDITSPASSSK
ncbi:uncharacterized protein LOC113233903 [Hyposmocoma kahamanoa]|uniref:uncharacterized protein LOC113233903 n=1 Tax=Hyposmocoma kahamanoa TaxID=1477025 RepID=UPI000E6D981C|nr:uncharacterized protein LOC113233903 [Hyposmocoma kahamanoa]